MVISKLISTFSTLFKGALSAKTFRKVVISAGLISALAVFAIRDGMFDSFDSAKTGLFVIVCAGLWMGMFDSILEVCGKRKALERDFFAGQSKIVYVISIVVLQSLRGLMQTAILFALSFRFIDFPDVSGLFASVWLDYFISLFLIIWSAQMLGLAISSLAKGSVGALKTAPLILIYQLIVSATLVDLPDVLDKFSGTTVCRWGLESLGSIFKIDSLPWLVENQYPQYDFFNPHDAAAYIASQGHLFETWGWLVILGVICVLLVLVGLLKNRQLR